ncbi:MAG: histidine kinase N-terminal 7TM domain-containing protein, partial [Treponemataceae bacterium]
MQQLSMQFDIYRIIAPIFCGFLLILLAISRTRSLRANPASKVFFLFVLATIAYLVANTLEISSLTPSDNLFWSRIIYLFIPFVPLLWFDFTLRIARDGKPLEPHYIVLLLVVPLITLVMVFSDTGMRYVWSSIDYIKVGKYVVSVRTHGPWFGFFAAYTYLVSLAGLSFSIRAFVLKRAYFQKRLALLLAGVSVPIAASLVFILKPFPGLVKDFTPIAYAISAFFFFLVIHRLDAFSIIPVAREQLVERMSDGILVFDAAHRIADANKAALDALNADESLLGLCLETEGIGSVELPPEIVAAASNGVRGVYTTRKKDGSIAYFSVEPIDLPGRTRSRGRLLILRDETELRVALSRLEELASTDSLTGLTNRRGFMESADSLISTALRYSEPICAAMFDLDNFKKVNDAWGHAVGDEV